jgi:hypothetical protein
MSFTFALPTIQEATKLFTDYSDTVDLLAKKHFQKVVGARVFEIVKTQVGYQIESTNDHHVALTVHSSDNLCLYDPNCPEDVEVIRQFGQRIFGQLRAMRHGGW